MGVPQHSYVERPPHFSFPLARRAGWICILFVYILAPAEFTSLLSIDHCYLHCMASHKGGGGSKTLGTGRGTGKTRAHGATYGYLKKMHSSDTRVATLPCCCLASTAGVNPRRFLEGFSWPEFQWRRGELVSQFEGCQVRERRGGTGGHRGTVVDWRVC